MGDLFPQAGVSTGDDADLVLSLVYTNNLTVCRGLDCWELLSYLAAQIGDFLLVECRLWREGLPNEAREAWHGGGFDYAKVIGVGVRELGDEATIVGEVRSTCCMFFDLCMFELGWKSWTRDRAPWTTYIQSNYNVLSKRKPYMIKLNPKLPKSA